MLKIYKDHLSSLGKCLILPPPPSIGTHDTECLLRRAVMNTNKTGLLYPT